MEFLTTSEILQVHEDIIGEFGGETGIIFRGQIEWCAETPQMMVYGSELFPTILDKAGSLMYCLIRSHPFVDGNKRTGLLVTSIFLSRNGYVLVSSKDDEVPLTLRIADLNISCEVNDVVEWLRNHVELQ
jgi:death-on-curing protein